MAMTATVTISISEDAVEKSVKKAVLGLPQEVADSPLKQRLEWIQANALPKLLNEAIETSPVRFGAKKGE